ncbi:MAG: hypothetical protein ACETVN_04105 [Asgard group archaeon]
MRQLKQTENWFINLKKPNKWEEKKGNMRIGSLDGVFSDLGIETPKRDKKVDFESIKKIGEAIKEDITKMKEILS